jgi:hypothetical protein
MGAEMGVADGVIAHVEEAKRLLHSQAGRPRTAHGGCMETSSRELVLNPSLVWTLGGQHRT